ncbi:MAG: DeoR/GlpR family DNA-binding transcription regulator [Burkholderiales bacterium]|nr:DeoR/GlpR family DNA-binding transcription regulator [Burkholderiales bacterium]
MSARDTPPRPDKRSRHERILTEVRTSAAIRISALARELGVSGETIRRDLAELGEAGLVSRTYGGATVRPFTAEPSVHERDRARVDERFRIGAAAAARVADGQIVMIDGGSTTFQVARHLAQRARGLTVLTNSVGVAAVAGANPTFRVMLCPGVFHAQEGAVLGEDTAQWLVRFHAHVAIIGASGVTGEGPVDAVPGAAVVKRVMIDRAAETLLVADHSKFGRASLETVCGWSGIGVLVTDRAPPPALADALARGGTGCVVA